jgi:hypothetical protein
VEKKKVHSIFHHQVILSIASEWIPQVNRIVFCFGLHRRAIWCDFVIDLPNVCIAPLNIKGFQISNYLKSWW